MRLSMHDVARMRLNPLEKAVHGLKLAVHLAETREVADGIEFRIDSI
jgi:hypothetical protein